ncbi:MAG: hypothetical protein IT214_07380 [Chitinophagaceae bacterium]|nr:hypothetical protein [Chitinophagaceae bacterium]
MKRFTVTLIFLFSVSILSAQSVPPEKVSGKIYMADGSNFTIKGTRPYPGHNIFDPSDPPETIPPANFQSFDANTMRVFDVAKSVPDLNPPVGFDAKFQIESFRRETVSMYYGWLRIWMFGYYTEWSTKKNAPSSETAQMAFAFINDPTILCGRKEYFRDTLQYRQISSDGKFVIDEVSEGENLKLKIIRLTKSLFAAYTIGDFLSGKTKYYQKKLIKWQQQLQTDQQNLKDAKPSSSNDPVAIMDDQIKQYKAEIAENKKELRTASGTETKNIEIAIESNEKMLASAENTRQQLASPEQRDLQSQFRNEALAADQKVIAIDQDKITDTKTKLEHTIELYKNLSGQQKNEQAFLKPISVIEDLIKEGQNFDPDDWDQLADPGEKNAEPIYRYNPRYFDKKIVIQIFS